MFRKIILLLTLCVFIPAAVVFAQESEQEEASEQKEDFWISLNGDGTLYGSEGFAYGGGLSLGYGSGSSIGVKAIWYFSPDQLNTLEINFIVRFYLRGPQAYSDPFIQFMGGPVFFGYRESAAIPSEIGMISAGICFGWRFLFIDRLFIEPSIRAGYPYIVAAGIAAGVRF